MSNIEKMGWVNLYRETVEILEKNSKSLNDIVWIGTKEATIYIDQFFKKAKETEYDNGYGGAVIAQDLIIVGSNWWLSRGEYDGAEWWDFNTLPRRPKMRKTKSCLKGATLVGGW